ncbi:GLPGLI family protein [Chryseobacterium sp. H1D6B]|uniref:GLPGLI family protein n=1 Tax=Chryseobacterium sp. H1D6B TaxID=2940588 RepID=UPI0015CBEF81|nr:GLPGLI family protein [Chryseobacterium sp. H1D6B]MDH6253101.1 GLPGLI family protein [Chryseobacterium sp. H1D6B]
MRFYIFISLLLSSILYSQSDTLKSQFEVIYRIKMFPDTLSKNNVIEEDLSLLIKDNKSLFKSNKKAIRDSIAFAVGKKSFENPVDGKVMLDMRNVPGVNFKSEVYFENGKQTIYKELLKNRFSYPLEDAIKWEIGFETKMIASYLCKKATGKYRNRNYIVWFTDAVPIPDGPYVFKGLPGLVLEAYDTKDYINFSIVRFKKAEKPIVIMKDATPTKYATFHKARQNFIDNPSGTFTNQTGLSVKPSDISRMNNTARRFNNYID